MSVVRVESLTRRYGAILALDKVTFSAEKGEALALLGPNGAGKSTTMKILATLLRPTSGLAEVAGYDTVREPMGVRHAIGMVFQDFSTDERLTGEENLLLHAQLFRLPSTAARARIEELLGLVGLVESRHRPVRTYSGGMRRRLEIIRALVHRPDILILDEPTAGLDAQTRTAVWNHLAELRSKEGLTILMSTHYIEEAEHCNRVAVLDHGKLAALGTPASLKAHSDNDYVTVESHIPIAQELRDRYNVSVNQNGIEYVISIANGMPFAKQMIADMGDRITGITVRKPTLEDVYLHITGSSIRPEEASDGDAVREQHQRMSVGGHTRR